jgi:methionyl-tRNA formyltransferase
MPISSTPSPISLVFLGTPVFACPALRTLSQDARFQVKAVVTQPDRPSGRGKKLTPPPIRTLAEELNLPCFQTVSIKKDTDLQAHLSSLMPDFFVTVAFGQILTQAVLDIPHLGTVNAHASLLPALRGANPIQQAILLGHPVTGITTMMTELGVDTGPMLKTIQVNIGDTESLGELSERLSQASGPLLVETLQGLANGSLIPKPQEHALATHAPKCLKEQAILDWNEPADLVKRKIFAFNPAPGAVTFLNGERLKVLHAQPAPLDTDTLDSQNPGQIMAVIENGILVACADAPLLLTSIQPAGKREMSARDWAMGQFKGERHPVMSFDTKALLGT